MGIYTSSVGLLFLLAAVAFPQKAEQAWTDAGLSVRERAGAVRGRVWSDNPIPGSATVELIGSVGTATSAVVDASGSFELQGLAPGQYQLRLTSGDGHVVHEEVVFIAGGDQSLSIYMASAPSTVKLNEATVSVHQLEHRVPARAQKEFDRGRAASMKENQTAALDHFLKASQIDPEFADAFNGIGVTFLALGEFQQAVDEFQKAIDLVPDHRGATANLCVALSRLDQPHEAAKVARRALRLDPSLLKVRYVLGLSLILEGGDKSEALDNLQRAAADIPKAHLLAARILAETGQREKAAKHVAEYLQAPSGDGINRQKIEAWLVQLQQ